MKNKQVKTKKGLLKILHLRMAIEICKRSLQSEQRRKTNGSFHSQSPKAVDEGSSISLKFSPFVTINNEISISWKFQLHTFTNQFLWQFEIFDFFVKIAKFKFGPILEFNLWKIKFLEASSSNFPWSSPESVPRSAKIISWTFGIRKNISFEISKEC